MYYKDVCSPSALALRIAFPTPESVANAALVDLCATRLRYMPSKKRLAQLRELARNTIGTKNAQRIRSLVIEQRQLIIELRLLDSHIEALDREIAPIVRASREGQIWCSCPGVAATHAATLIAYAGNLANFENEAAFRAYCGWSPTEFQSGRRTDYSTLKKSGHNTLKSTVFLIVMSAIAADTPFRTLYDRLVPIKCPFNERTGKYERKMKVIGRVGGQLLGVMYRLLRADADVLASLKEGEDIPAPVLYDPAKHHVRRASHELSPMRLLVEQGEGEERVGGV